MATTGRGKSGSKTQGGQQTKASTASRSRSRAATAKAEVDAAAAAETPVGSGPAQGDQTDPAPIPETAGGSDPAPVAAGDEDASPPATTQTDPPSGGGGGAGNGGGGGSGDGGSEEDDGRESENAISPANVYSGFVVVGSVVFVLVMLYIFNIQIREIENSAKTTNIDRFVETVAKLDDFKAKDIIGIGQLYMEKDAQFLRTERAQSLVGTRLTVMVIAELIGLCLIVLGSSFIFAQIRGKSDFGSSNGNWTVKLVSEFPGVILCFFGTVIVIWALNASIDKNARISTNDRPLYMPSDVYIDSIKRINVIPSNKKIKYSKTMYKNCMESMKNEEQCAKYKSDEDK